MTAEERTLMEGNEYERHPQELNQGKERAGKIPGQDRAADRLLHLPPLTIDDC